MQSYNLIQVNTQDDLKLSGHHLPGDTNKPACIFIHGFTADFYSHNFYHSIANAIREKNSGLILSQTRGTGVQTEFLTSSGEGKFIGSYFERIEDAHLDISAFVEYLLDLGHKEIILIGHSLGTIKSVRYLFEGEYASKITKLILISPFDKNAFMQIKAPGKLDEFLQFSKSKIDAGMGYDAIPTPEYEDYPMSYQTFYSWYQNTDLNKIWDFYKKDYGFPALNKIAIPVKAILGDKDEFVTYPSLNVTPQIALDTIKKNVSNSTIELIPGAGHTYFGFENALADAVSSFI